MNGLDDRSLPVDGPGEFAHFFYMHAVVHIAKAQIANSQAMLQARRVSANQNHEPITMLDNVGANDHDEFKDVLRKLSKATTGIPFGRIRKLNV